MSHKRLHIIFSYLIYKRYICAIVCYSSIKIFKCVSLSAILPTNERVTLGPFWSIPQSHQISYGLLLFIGCFDLDCYFVFLFLFFIFFLYFFFHFPTRQLMSPNLRLLSFEWISHANVYRVSTFSHFEHRCAMSNASRRFFSHVLLFNQHFSLILFAYICLFLSTILNRYRLKHRISWKRKMIKSLGGLKSLTFPEYRDVFSVLWDSNYISFKK